MARPKNKSATETIRVTVPLRLYEYLCHLAGNTILGASEHEVASYLVTRAAQEMLEKGFHRIEVPKT